MKNTDLQNRLDKEKWYCSESAGTDLSGQMPYCGYCVFRKSNGDCVQPHKSRVENSDCAKAFNKMRKGASKQCK